MVFVMMEHGLRYFDALNSCRIAMLTCFGQPLEFYYMINYYFKYLELLDTVFLALKKKPLGKLQEIHARMKSSSQVLSVPPCFPPFRDRVTLLHTTERTYQCGRFHSVVPLLTFIDFSTVLGSHHLEPHGPCLHVYVLLAPVLLQ